MRDNTLKPWLLAASIAALLVPCVADSAGLGRLAVLSALGQPLNAEIELLAVQKGESIAAKLASVDTYQQANLQFNPALIGTRLTVEKRPNGQLFLKATTAKPVSEPFVELVVELNSEHGRVTRQYTILLDPPGYGRAAADIAPPAASVAVRPAPPAPAPQETIAADAAEPATPLAATEPAPETTAASPATEPSSAPTSRSSGRITAAPAPSSASSSDREYSVKPGDTLTRIARTVQPAGASLEQTLVGLFRHNPEAFIKKNMNLVKSGKILRIPDGSEITAVSQAEAAQEIHVQIADFNALRAKLADQAPSAREEGSVTSGRIGARVAEPGASEARDTVRLSKGESPSGKASRSGNAADRVRALEEEAVAREKALVEANERIAQLEKTIKDMQRLVELKSSGMATAQQQTDKSPAKKSTPAPRTEIPTAAVIEPEKKAEAPRTPPAADAAKDAATASKSAAPEAAKAAAADASKAATPQPKPAAVAKAKTVTPPPAESEDLLETIMNEPLYLAAGGAAILLGGLGVVMVRRRRKDNDEIKDDDDLVKIPPKFGPGAAATAGAAGAATASAASKAPAPEPVDEDDEQIESTDSTDGANDDEVQSQFHHAAEAPTPVNAEAVADHPVEENVATQPAFADFNLDTPAARPSAPDLRVAQEPAPEDEPAEMVVRDFGLGTGAPATASMQTAAAPAARDFNSVDFNLDALPAIDGAAADTALAERVDAVPDAAMHEFKLDDLDLSFGEQPGGRDVVKDDHWYDVQQKFDLAKAYEEMGDKDGARDILQEVVKEGDTEQQSQAKTLLAALG